MIIVVTGPPCAGKSTYVDEHRGPDDLVIDLDRLAHALGYPADHVELASDHLAAKAARAARALLIKATLADRTIRSTVWLIDSRPEPWQRSNYTRAGAQFVELDPGRDECMRRALAGDRPDATVAQVAEWFGTPIDATSVFNRSVFEDVRLIAQDSSGSPPRDVGKTGATR